MSFPLGLSSYTFPWAVGVESFLPVKRYDIPDLIQKTVAAGLHRLQICDNIAFDTLPLPHQLPAEFQLEIGTRRLTQENLLLYLSFCESMGSPFLRVVIDDVDYHPTEDEVIEVIREVLPHFKKANVILALENHDRFSVASLVRIIHQTDRDWVGICLDTANSFGAAEGVKEVVEALAPYTVNFHCKDFVIKRLPHKMGFTIEGCPTGTGMLNVPWVLQTLRKYNRCLSMTLEVWSSPEANLEATLSKEQAWVEQSIHYLKQQI
ncbi:MAG: sugar phosphate isomerase/epimerase [Spirosomaceae bacterium]|nr:sugar phosphate isomerase/epimerase [Spirosomataceae bacterium]